MGNTSTYQFVKYDRWHLFIAQRRPRMNFDDKLSHKLLIRPVRLQQRALLYQPNGETPQHWFLHIAPRRSPVESRPLTCYPQLIPNFKRLRKRSFIQVVLATPFLAVAFTFAGCDFLVGPKCVEHREVITAWMSEFAASICDGVSLVRNVKKKFGRGG